MYGIFARLGFVVRDDGALVRRQHDGY